MPPPQSLHRHVSRDPAVHFFIFPVLGLNVFLAIYIVIHFWPAEPLLHLWLVFLALALAVLAVKVRAYSLKVQDRVIRLEERVRLASLLAPADLPRIGELSMCQLIALRFASDAEIPVLVHKTLTENLDPTAIKQNILSWRADLHRV